MSEVFPRVEPAEIAHLWDGREPGWVILWVDRSQAAGFLFANRERSSTMMLDAEEDNYLELLEAARAHGVPEVYLLEVEAP